MELGELAGTDYRVVTDMAACLHGKGGSGHLWQPRMDWRKWSLGVDITQQSEQREAADGRRGIAAQVEMQEAAEGEGGVRGWMEEEEEEETERIHQQRQHQRRNQEQQKGAALEGAAGGPAGGEV